MQRKLLTILLGLGALSSMACPSFAQGGFVGNQYGRGSDPNLGHFYMGRQEVQIMDDAPYVNDMRTNPAAQQQQRGAAPNRPQPLPRAGFMPYASSLQSMSSSLPKVNNGVPQKMPVAPPPGVDPRMAKAGKYKPATAKPASPGPRVAKSYAPYKGYGGPSGGGAGGAYSAPQSAHGTSTAVSGSMLHWSRTGH